MELTFKINTDELEEDCTLRTIDVAELLEGMNPRELELTRRLIFWVLEQNV